MTKKGSHITFTTLDDPLGLMLIPICNGSMHKVQLYEFYRLGGFIHPLTKLRSRTKLKTISGELYSANAALDSISSDPEMPMPLLRSPILGLNKVIYGMIVKYQANHSAVMTTLEARELAQRAKIFEKILKVQFDNMDVYFVSKKAAYDTTVLVDHGEELIPDGIREHISKRAQNEIKQAGRCIAFNLPSAAGFHLTKALEDVAHTYYKFLTGKSGPKGISLGKYIDLILEAKGRGKISSALRYIVNNYRNKLVHTSNLSMNQALALLGLTQNAILAVVEEMGKGIFDEEGDDI